MNRLLVALLVLGSAVSAWADEESDGCFKCHGDPKAVELRKALKDPKRDIRSLIMDKELWARSKHADVSCTDCHEGVDEHPHEAEVTTTSCADCHEDEAAAAAKSIHAAMREDGSGPHASCTDCHDVHGLIGKDERDGAWHPLNVHQTCGKCHFSQDPAGLTKAQLLLEKYSDDAHARGILKAGLTVSPTCVTCHGGHETRPSADPNSRVARDKVAALCGTCHVGPLEEYRASVHFLKSDGDQLKGATCTDCHVPHGMDVDSHEFQTASVKACSACHEEKSSTYSQTYHGKVMSLGPDGRSVATCSSCHGNHAIYSSTDPQSMTHEDNLVGTCAQCHQNANSEFARYIVHADPHDAEAFPKLNFVYTAMTWLLLLTFAVAIIHAILWLVRGLAAKDYQRAPVPKTERWFRRWPELYSRLHVGMMVSFLLLAGTGLPLHYSDKPWARNVMKVLGGTRSASLLHRIGAVILITVIVVYLVHILRRAFVKKEKGIWAGPNTMLPRWKDFQDVGANIRWFLFLGPRPRFDRWTYWEKFDFWAVFWGIAVIGGSGLALWFPEEATLILPGWVLNVAVIVHGHEALLAVGFIFSIHLFHTHLRPEKFPMDTVFFTGRISEEEMKRERPLEYERLKAEGKLDEATSRRPRRRTRVSAYVSGTIALIIGIALVVGMLAALIGD